LSIEVGKTYLTGWGQKQTITGSKDGIFFSGGEHYTADGTNTSRPGWEGLIDDYRMSPLEAIEFWLSRMQTIFAANDVSHLRLIAGGIANMGERIGYWLQDADVREFESGAEARRKAIADPKRRGT